MDLLRREVPASALVVAVDPSKAFNPRVADHRRAWCDPVSLPVLRDGVDELPRLIAASGVGGSPVLGLEATCGLHRAWAAEIERRSPGSLGLCAPTETTAARAQLGSRRFKTDDRDCAALCGLCARVRGGEPSPRRSTRWLGWSLIAASGSVRSSA